MQYFPLASDRFRHDFGVRALPAEQSIIDVTGEHAAELALRASLLDQNRDAHFRAAADSLDAQRDAFDWIDRQTGGVLTKPPSGEPPLLTAGRQVQEDLVLLRDDFSAGYPICAGVVCFPSGWSIEEKLEQNVWQVHDVVPEFAALAADKTVRLLRGLKPLRPVWRLNWGVRSSAELNQTPARLAELACRAEPITARNAGRRCWFRVERQTMTRLAGGAILFTIHTYQVAVESLDAPQRGRLLGTLQTCPEATLRYKGIWPFRCELMEYLRSAAG
ncbi:heme-dependent oxidative N-demethylase family protein [Roseimaritima sediminicola]|uniref:heme-dependent oxidative N-demethylase family protein n=1 Tax=Roseimaritima sediminicola TaxID=2662066 RepID=UPI0012982BCE|nr:DUF3445 domain-containing protein [Roseimaritima sediminicola]